MTDQPEPEMTRVSVRMTRDLHKLLTEEAEKTGRSLNSEIVTRLVEGMTFGLEPWTESGERQMSSRLVALAQTCESFTLVIEELYEAILEHENQYPLSRRLRWHGWRNLARATVATLVAQGLSTSEAKLRGERHPSLAAFLAVSDHDVPSSKEE